MESKSLKQLCKFLGFEDGRSFRNASYLLQETKDFFTTYESRGIKLSSYKTPLPDDAKICARSFSSDWDRGPTFWTSNSLGDPTWPEDEVVILEALSYIFNFYARDKALKEKRKGSNQAKPPKEMSSDQSINSEKVSLPPEGRTFSAFSNQVPLAPDSRRLSIRVYLDALDPQYNQTILAEFTMEWINRDFAQWPATADPRVDFYMHEHDLYLHNAEFEDDSKILPLINSLRRGTEMESRGGFIEFKVFKDRVIERIVRSTSRFLGMDDIGYHEDGFTRKKGIFKDCWQDFSDYLTRKRDFGVQGSFLQQARPLSTYQLSPVLENPQNSFDRVESHLQPSLNKPTPEKKTNKVRKRKPPTTTRKLRGTGRSKDPKYDFIPLNIEALSLPQYGSYGMLVPLPPAQGMFVSHERGEPSTNPAANPPHLPRLLPDPIQKGPEENSPNPVADSTSNFQVPPPDEIRSAALVNDEPSQPNQNYNAPILSVSTSPFSASSDLQPGQSLAQGAIPAPIAILSPISLDFPVEPEISPTLPGSRGVPEAWAHRVASTPQFRSPGAGPVGADSPVPTISDDPMDTQRDSHLLETIAIEQLQPLTPSPPVLEQPQAEKPVQPTQPRTSTLPRFDIYTQKFSSIVKDQPISFTHALSSAALYCSQNASAFFEIYKTHSGHTTNLTTLTFVLPLANNTRLVVKESWDEIQWKRFKRRVRGMVDITLEEEPEEELEVWVYAGDQTVLKVKGEDYTGF